MRSVMSVYKGQTSVSPILRSIQDKEIGTYQILFDVTDDSKTS